MINYTPVQQNFTLYEGDDTTVEFTSEMGDISVYSIQLQARLSGNSRYALINVQGNVIDGPDGKYSIVFSSADTLGKSDSKPLEYDIKFTSTTDGTVHTDRYGQLTVQARTTGLPPVINREGINVSSDDTIKIYAATQLDFDSTYFSIDETSPANLPSGVTVARVMGKSTTVINNDAYGELILGKGIKGVPVPDTDVITIQEDPSLLPWEYQDVTLAESPVAIDDIDKCGIEYDCQFNGLDTSDFSFHLYSDVPDGAQIKVRGSGMTSKSKPIYVYQVLPEQSWNVVTPTVFSARGGKWYVEESSQLLALTTTTLRDSEAEKIPVHGITVDPSSPLSQNITDEGVLVLGAEDYPEVPDVSDYQRLDADEIDYPMVLKNGVQVLTVEDILDGGDIQLDDYQRKDDPNPTYKQYSIDSAGSGNPNFTSTIHQDNELHTVIDATKELRINHKDIGTGLTTGIASVDNTQAQFLVPIMQGNDAVALAKDIPEVPSLSGYVEKYKRADLDYVRVTYQGKYSDDANYYPVSINQDSNGWTFFKFTGNMVIECRDKESGNSLGRPLEIGETMATFNVPPYFGDKKLVAAHTSPILSKLQTQRTTRPDFPPVSIYVDEYHNTIMEVNAEFKLRHVDGEGNTTQTVQTSVDRWNFLVQPKYNNDNLVAENTNVSFNKVSISGTRKDTAYNNFSVRGSVDGGDSGEDLILKTYLRPDGSESPDYIQYFGQTKGNHQLANTESVNEAISDDKAKGEWIGGVLKDTVNNDGNPEDDFTCNDPKHWLEYRKTAFNGSYALTVNQGQNLISSEIVIHLHAASGMASAPFKVVTNDGNEVTRTIRMGEKWRFFLRTGTNPYFEKIDDGLQSGATDSTFDGEGFGVPERTETGAETIIQRDITGNYRNTSSELGDFVVNLRTDNGVKNFRLYYSLPYGTLDSGRKVYVRVDEKAGNVKTIRAGEIWQCEVKAGRFYDTFFWSKVTDGTSSFEAIDVSGFDIDEPKVKPLLKRFTDTDLVEIPLSLPEGFTVIVRQVVVRRGSGVESDMGFTYRHDNNTLRVHMNEVSSGLILAGIIKDEV